MSLKFMLVLDSWISYSQLYERQGCLLTSAKQNGLYIHLRQLFFFVKSVILTSVKLSTVQRRRQN